MGRGFRVFGTGGRVGKAFGAADRDASVFRALHPPIHRRQLRFARRRDAHVPEERHVCGDRVYRDGRHVHRALRRGDGTQDVRVPGLPEPRGVPSVVVQHPGRRRRRRVASHFSVRERGRAAIVKAAARVKAPAIGAQAPEFKAGHKRGDRVGSRHLARLFTRARFRHGSVHHGHGAVPGEDVVLLFGAVVRRVRRGVCGDQ
mmetsp:Transcript_5006/g.21290  ORF Transcript_5006/g.21290 Transcript_5006/m.21290 type:complete len:202 (-) Transcript_5006:1770-2375(-)